MIRHALITGATRGIGRALADRLAPEYHLYIGGRRSEACARVAATYPAATPWPVDLRDEAAVDRAAATIETLDVLIHCAGVVSTERIADSSRAHWRELFEINVFAPVQLTQALLPALRRRGGQVLAVNSGAGYRAAAGWSAYAASKFALRAFTDALREEERESLRVISIHPGRVDTDMQVQCHAATSDEPYDPDRHLRAETVAQVCAQALELGPDAMIENLEIRPR